jgi:hypothetical protein
VAAARGDPAAAIRGCGSKATQTDRSRRLAGGSVSPSGRMAAAREAGLSPDQAKTALLLDNVPRSRRWDRAGFCNYESSYESGRRAWYGETSGGWGVAENFEFPLRKLRLILGLFAGKFSAF